MPERRRIPTSAKPYDAISRALLDRYAADWLQWLGLPPSSVQVKDTALSTVTAAADKVYLLDHPDPYLAQ